MEKNYSTILGLHFSISVMGTRIPPVKLDCGSVEGWWPLLVTWGLQQDDILHTMLSWDCSSISRPWNTLRSSVTSLRPLCISSLLEATSLFSSSV
jgi:hypothetical protein